MLKYITILKKKNLVIILLSLAVLLAAPDLLLAAEEGHRSLGLELPIWSVIPFVGMLLSIAIFPLVKPHWWENNLLRVAFFWSLTFLIPFAIGFGSKEASHQFMGIILLDYLPVIVLLWGLFAVAGGIVLKGSLSGSPKVNLALLLVGMFLASWVGTTGASMLLIRPMIRANRWRERKAHMIVFFILFNTGVYFGYDTGQFLVEIGTNLEKMQTKGVSL